MTYEHDQLKQALSNVLNQSSNNNYSVQTRMTALESRVAELEAYIAKAKPYIDTFVLIDSSEKAGTQPCP